MTAPESARPTRRVVMRLAWLNGAVSAMAALVGAAPLTPGIMWFVPALPLAAGLAHLGARRAGVSVVVIAALALGLSPLSSEFFRPAAAEKRGLFLLLSWWIAWAALTLWIARRAATRLRS